MTFKPGLFIVETKIEGHEVTVRLADYADHETANSWIECRVHKKDLRLPGTEDPFDDLESRELGSLHQAVLRWIRDATKPETQRLGELAKHM